MQQDTKVKGPSIRLSTVATSTRQTAKTDFGTVMREGLIKGANVAVEGLKVAAPFIPGSAIVSAAVAGANLASTVGRPGYGGGSAAIRSGGAALRSGGYGTSSGALTAPGGSPGGGSPVAPGGYGNSGSLAVPGAHPSLNTNLNTAPSSFAGGGNFGGGAEGAGIGASTDAFAQMMSATQRTAEFQASFNLQYLELQQRIQQDTRQFNLISNIMKTKHDAAKNALNNVR